MIKRLPTLHSSFFHNLYIKDVHEGVKPYQCSACPAAFSQRSKMILHYESIHEGKKPHKCSQCDKSFAQKNQLNSHVTGVHEGKKPFDCPICGTTFKRKHQVRYWILISTKKSSWGNQTIRVWCLQSKIYVKTKHATT